MDAEEKMKLAIEQAVKERLRPLQLTNQQLYQIEDAIMDELDLMGRYHDDGTFVVYPDEPEL